MQPADLDPYATDADLAGYYTSGEVDDALDGKAAKGIAGMVAGESLWVFYNGTDGYDYNGVTLTTRPTSRSDVTVVWVGGATAPPLRLAGSDIWLKDNA